MADIYGNNPGALKKLNLPGDIVASSFGQLASSGVGKEGVGQEDLARAVLMMTTNNIAHIAYLTAQLHQTSRIYFIGNFLRHNAVSCRRLSYSIDYWSGGKVEALFLEVRKWGAREMGGALGGNVRKRFFLARHL